MPFKVFLAPTGSGNTVFEGDVINGYTTPDGKNVVLKFYSNDRGYTCGSFGFSDKSGKQIDAEGAKALRDEFANLIETNAAKTGVFSTDSSQKHFRLSREVDGAPMILAVIGTDPRFGTSYHRGDAESFKKVLAEFDTVLKTIEDVKARKLPAEK
ncbi:MAG TPA: hypothetical protein VEK08_20645 [Planctomycetota bacterium]|nr:hypothetical protein [Planctomycetota bacterium]